MGWIKKSKMEWILKLTNRENVNRRIIRTTQTDVHIEKAHIGPELISDRERERERERERLLAHKR